MVLGGIIVGLLILRAFGVNPEDIESVKDLGILVVASGFVVGLVVVTFLWRRERARLCGLELADVDGMTGVEFEKYVGRLLEFQGYKVQFTKASGDYGVDILAQMDGRHFAIQLKRYAESVGREAISDAVTGMLKYRKDAKAMVITNSYFTKQAREVAELNNCRLVDRSDLSDWIVQFQKGNKRI